MPVAAAAAAVAFPTVYKRTCAACSPVEPGVSFFAARGGRRRRAQREKTQLSLAVQRCLANAGPSFRPCSGRRDEARPVRRIDSTSAPSLVAVTWPVKSSQLLVVLCGSFIRRHFQVYIWRVRKLVDSTRRQAIK